MIRKAIPSDLKHIYDLTVEFNQRYYDVPLDKRKTLQALRYIIRDGVCFVSPKGFIGGMFSEDPFRNWTFLGEYGWYATDVFGAALLDEFVEHGKKNGADEIRLCTMHTSPESAERILIKRGFTVADKSWALRP